MESLLTSTGKNKTSPAEPERGRRKEECQRERERNRWMRNDMTDKSSPTVYENENTSSMGINRINCPRCSAPVPDAPFCCQCGKMLQKKITHKRRGNGQGTILQRDGKYKAVVTLGYWLDEEGKVHRKTRSKTFALKKDAVAALATLKQAKATPASSITFRELFDRWLPTHKAGRSTMDCYRSAFRYFEPLWFLPVDQISVDDLQECIDNCGKGRRTMENMRAVAGLVFKYGVPRKLCEMNLAQYLTIDAEHSEHRTGFTMDEVQRISGSNAEGADIILCMIYTGFRPSEFLSLKGKDYDRQRQCLIGGAKTEAGKNRVVTISPKIQCLIPDAEDNKPLFGHGESLKAFTEKFFYPALERIGIDNPVINARHKYTPHSCRHTFATLMKSAAGADKDKLELIGHASSEMLRYYQDVGIEDLRKITDQL